MKINFKFHISVFILLAMIFSAPFVTFAQQNSVCGGAEVAAAQDAQAFILEARTAAARDANSDINQLFLCFGGSLVTLSAVGCAFLGCMLGEALDNPRQLDPYVDPEGAGHVCVVISTGMIYGCLGGWGIGFAGSVYGIYKLGATVPSERLIGKSSEYVEVYTATYKRKLAIQRAKTAAVGSVILQGLFLLWAIGDF